MRSKFPVGILLFETNYTRLFQHPVYDIIRFNPTPFLLPYNIVNRNHKTDSPDITVVRAYDVGAFQKIIRLSEQPGALLATCTRP